MSNSFYEETLLKEEFLLVVRLQQDTEFSKWVSVSYEDRATGKVQSVTVQPKGPRYPEKYIVEYLLPVYVSTGQLRRDWHGTATILLSEPVLTNRHSNQGPYVTFHSNFEPLNHHVRQNSICSGNAWLVARENGIWHFIISLGALINQDEFVCAEGGHMNDAGYRYWVARDRKPVTNIKWPLNLLGRTVEFKPINIRESPKVQTLAVSRKPEKKIINVTKGPGRLDIHPKPAAPKPTGLVITKKR